MAIRSTFTTGEVLTAADLTDTIKGAFINTETTTARTLGTADAGNLVTLNNNSGGTVTIPTNTTWGSPLGTLVHLINIGTAGSFTVGTAAGVTLNAASATLAIQEGGTLIKTATNTWQFVKGSAPPTASGLAFITAQTFTSASAVSVNNCFSATYSQYRVIAAFTNTGGAITLRMRSGGTDNTASTYSGNAPYVTDWNGAFGAHSTVNQTSVTLNGSGSARFVFDYVFYEPFVAIATAITGTWVEDRGGFGFAAYHNTASSFDGFSVLGTGMTGNIRIYGFRNS